MRDTIDFGIDLGTTNSAIAVVEHGAVEVIKNDDQSEITPSAVWLRSAHDLRVGRQAREAAEANPDDVAMEFKLKMGLADAAVRFAKAEVSLTPPQLSAEVLKSLRSDAEVRFGAPPEAAVITVPAAFALNQNNATNEAAKLAGFTAPCPLLQEPTAAAFAFGFHEAAERAYWMVFDFGGGTFDAAIVSKRDDELQVLNHAGDPYLGGKLIDWAVVDQVLAPAVSREFGFAEFHRGNPDWRANFAKLKAAAERAKIQLSRRETAAVTVELLNPDGGYEPFSYDLTRGELDRVAEPFYQRALRCCRDALTEGGLRPDDIDKLLLVGGATLAPGLRRLLADPTAGLGIPLDMSQDPSTVVARGAALFASTIRMERPVAPPKVGEFTVDLSYDPVVTTTTPLVAGRLNAASPVHWTEYSVSLHNPDGRPPFHSGQIRVNAEGAFAAEVVVPEQGTARFTLELADATGRRQRVTPDSFSLTHGVGFGGAVLTHTLGIGTKDNIFTPMLPKGTALPARHRQTFATSIPLRRSEPDAVIRIPVVEADLDQPRTDRNFQVGMLEIRPRDVRVDLPAGSEVEVTFEIDSSRLVTVVADVPVAGVQVEAEIDLSNVRAPDAGSLAEQLQQAEERLARLREQAPDDPAARQRLAELEDGDAWRAVRDQVRAAGQEQDTALAASRELRSRQAALDKVEEAVQLPAARRRLNAVLDECVVEMEHSGRPEDRRELDDLRARAAEVRDLATADKLRQRGLDLLFDLRRRRSDWPVLQFDALRSFRGVMRPASDAAELIQRGERLIASGDYEGLRSVNERLRRLIPPDQEDVEGWLVQR